MSVFISHRSTDSGLATYIYHMLANHDVSAYLDLLDESTQTAEDITGTILKGLEGCTHLVAAITEDTVGSWWVPFEIGVATEGGRRIATFLHDSERDTLPEFLHKWPIMTSNEDLAEFARLYHKDRDAADKQAAAGIADHRRDADNFHSELKKAIGQEPPQ